MLRARCSACATTILLTPSRVPHIVHHADRTELHVRCGCGASGTRTIPHRRSA